MSEPIGHFYNLLIDGDAAAAASLFAGEPQLDTPLAGTLRGEAALARYVAEQQAWLAARGARVMLFAQTASSNRTVAELGLELTLEGASVDLPVALVADHAGSRIAALRVYHSTWPLTGGHRLRPPLLPPAEGLDEPAAVRDYLAALAAGDVEGVLRLYAPDGYVREPSGDRFRHHGADALRPFYGAMLAQGGIALQRCSVTYDGMRCAIEYVCTRWGSAPLPPQASTAVYDLMGINQISAARIYDDIAPPGA